MFWPFNRKKKKSAATKEPTGPISLRRWESAETSRLNRKHWASAHGNSINTDLASDLETLRARSAYEAARNPMVEGVIATHCVDVVGQTGPSLQIQSDNQSFIDEVESAWLEWFAMPDYNGLISGPELLKLWVRMLWLAGEYVTQETFDEEGGPVRMRLRNVHPRRLATPPEKTGSNVSFGIEIDKFGKPVRYWIRNEELYGNYTVSNYGFTDYAAEFIEHRFLYQEPDQLRGVPWLATALQPIADLRDYDEQVLDAARAAADQSVLLQSMHPEAPYVEAQTQVEVERRTISTLPPGWTAFQMTPQQPATQYVEFRKERLREIGRAINMPLMMILLSSADSNFSSAHYDGQVYIRGIQQLQSWMARNSLEKYVAKIIRELALSRVITAEIPEYSCEWTWPVPPYVDPKKMHDALHARLTDGTAAYSDVLAAYGLDLETTIMKRQRENEMLESVGLDPVKIETKNAEKPVVEGEEGDNADNSN